MSGTEQTYHVTGEDVKKAAARGDANAPALQSIVDSAENKGQTIDSRKSDLPLPDQPSRASDFNSADASINATGSEARQAAKEGSGESALREPTTGYSAARVDGDELKTHTQL